MLLVDKRIIDPHLVLIGKQKRKRQEQHQKKDQKDVFEQKDRDVAKEIRGEAKEERPKDTWEIMEIEGKRETDVREERIRIGAR